MAPGFRPSPLSSIRDTRAQTFAPTRFQIIDEEPAENAAPVAVTLNAAGLRSKYSNCGSVCAFSRKLSGKFNIALAYILTYVCMSMRLTGPVIARIPGFVYYKILLLSLPSFPSFSQDVDDFMERLRLARLDNVAQEAWKDLLSAILQNWTATTKDCSWIML